MVIRCVKSLWPSGSPSSDISLSHYQEKKQKTCTILASLSRYVDWHLAVNLLHPHVLLLLLLVPVLAVTCLVGDKGAEQEGEIARRQIIHAVADTACVRLDRCFLVLARCAAALVLSSTGGAKSFHFLQPSKSMSACMQPHSMTFRSSQTKLTGYGYSQSKMFLHTRAHTNIYIQKAVGSD